MVESWPCFVAVPASQTFLREVIREALAASGIQALGTKISAELRCQSN